MHILCVLLGLLYYMGTLELTTVARELDRFGSFFSMVFGCLAWRRLIFS